MNKKILIPHLYCPIKSRINPHVKLTVNHTNQWVRQFDLHRDEDFKKYDADNFGYMTARFYPTAHPENLCLANDINVLLFVMDDAMDNQVDRADLISSRNNFEIFIAEIMHILRKPKGSIHLPNGIFEATKDIWLRLIEISSPEWQAEFILSIEKMFTAALWEYDNVAVGKSPTVAEFYEKRQYLGAAHISTDMIPVIESIKLPEDILLHPLVSELTVLARNAVCWANDLFSLSKEEEHGDQHNMVIIMKSENQCSLQEAVALTAKLHDKDMTKFISLGKELLNIADNDLAISRYIQTLGAILKGNIDWSSYETKRYQFTYQDAGPQDIF
jgi:hypothetical protein